MKLSSVVDELGLEVRSARQNLGSEVTGGYVSDLLSDVLANSREGNLWVTLQRHQNIVAVASMKELAGIVLVCGREPEDETLEKAEAEDLPILVSELPAFELVGRLYNLGIQGTTHGRE
jgi:hypothetical protein